MTVQELFITSVGIDVGTSTSHMVFSKLHLVKQMNRSSKKFEIVNRKILYRGKIYLTPLIDKETIDFDELSKIFQKEFSSAGITKTDIDTGAVIVTGETAKKKNAEKIVSLLAAEAGKFVAATAGPNFESVIAAMGSGAVTQAKKLKKTIMNIDTGGGTSNIAVISPDGYIIDTACINVGGRLLVTNGSGNIVEKIEDAAQIVADDLGIKVEIGKPISKEDKELIAKGLVKALIEVITKQDNISQVTMKIMMTPLLTFDGKVDLFSFSGGVAEYLYGKTNDYYHDIGKEVAKEIKKQSQKAKIKLHEPLELIRATVIGAGQYSLQVSGATTLVTDDNEFPIRNIPVVVPYLPQDSPTEEEIKHAIDMAYKRIDLKEGESPVALSFHKTIGLSYERLKSFAKGIVSAVPTIVKKEMPLILVFNDDIGNSVGNVMKRETELKSNIISIDELGLREGDYIDIGEPMASKQVVPVVIKTLIFEN
ncbi:MAG: ethanolamine ammonia-lyase reactivating factor EutA [Candidatus Heimdallarchaeota archaeon]|nr:ethanolamine ammonia-lyase reactivating factor EutA [Candidatus Heimdallarchaeota archaeon]